MPSFVDDAGKTLEIKLTTYHLKKLRDSGFEFFEWLRDLKKHNKDLVTLISNPEKLVQVLAILLEVPADKVDDFERNLSSDSLYSAGIAMFESVHLFSQPPSAKGAISKALKRSLEVGTAKAVREFESKMLLTDAMPSEARAELAPTRTRCAK